MESDLTLKEWGALAVKRIRSRKDVGTVQPLLRHLGVRFGLVLVWVGVWESPEEVRDSIDVTMPPRLQVGRELIG